MIDDEYIDRAGYTQKDYHNIERSRDLNIQTSSIKSDEEVKREERVFNRKLIAFRALLRRIESDVNGTLKALGVSVSGIKLDNSYSAGKSDRELITKLNFFQNNNGSRTVGVVNMNLNVKKLLKYPSLELYSLVSTSVLKSVLGKDDMDKVQDVIYKQGNLAGVVKEKTDVLNNAFDRKRAIFILKNYINGFLHDYNNGEVYGFAELVASQLVDKLDDANLKKLLSYNFASIKDIENNSLKISAEQSINSALFVRNLRDSRLKAIHDRIITYSERGVDASKINDLRQQELALSNDRLKGKFNDAKQAIAKGDKNELMNYCNTFATSFCESFGVDSVPIRFVNKPNFRAVGQFHDQGEKGQFVEINLGRIDNIIDLSTTLTHELTHAVEASINKKNGAVNKDGTGLLNDMSEDISNSGLAKGTKEYALLKEINTYCYYVNPNERHARQNEVSAYKFMLDFAKDDPTLKNQLNESISGRYDPKTQTYVGGYVQYLQKTTEYLNNIDESIKKFTDTFNKLDIPSTTKGYKEIADRIEYLKLVKEQYISNGKGRESIDFANKLLDTLNKNNDKATKKGENEEIERAERNENAMSELSEENEEEKAKKREEKKKAIQNQQTISEEEKNKLLEEQGLIQ